MSVDAAQAEFLDEPVPESPLKDRLSQALPKAPAGLQWKVGITVADEVSVTLQSREGTFKGGSSVKVVAVDEDRIIGQIANVAKDLVTEHTRRGILRELSGAYEGEIA